MVGAGYIAVELAGVINALGAKTHLFVRKHAPLRSFDPMISETLVEVMNAEGPQLHTHAVPKAVVKNADGSLTLELEDGRSETVDCLIWAIGREPSTDNINLAAGGRRKPMKKVTSLSINSRIPTLKAFTPLAITPAQWS